MIDIFISLSIELSFIMASPSITCTMETMARTGREWTELDREIMRIIFDARDAMPNQPSLRETARRIGVSQPRVLDLRDGRHGQPDVDEYINLCQLFGLDPAETLDRALKATGR